MLVLITKASDNYWYEFKEVDTIDDLLEIYSRIIVEPNPFDEESVDFWDGFKKEDVPKMKKARINVIIYDDYVE